MLIDKNYALNNIGRSHDIRDTLDLLMDLNNILNFNINIKMSKPFKYLCHSTLRVSDIDFVVNGKGPNDVIALVSAHAELIERISAFPESWHDSTGGLHLLRQPAARRELFGKIYDHEYLEGRVDKRYNELSNIVDISMLLKNTGFSERQVELIKEKSIYTKFWAPAKAVFEMDKTYYIPIQLVKILQGTNGLASGRTLLEATMHGTLEVLERYIFERLLRTEEATPTIDKNTIDDEYINSSLEYFEENDIEVVLKDFSLDLGIPAIGAVTFNKKLTPEHRGYNTMKIGVATNTRNAVMRALTERMQGTTFAEERLLGKIDDRDRHLKYHMFFNKGKAFFDLSWLKQGDIVPIKTWAYENTDSVFNILKQIINKLESKLLVVDFTHKKLKFPVVQIIVPGISDNVLVYTKNFQTMAYLGGVDEKLLAVEDNLEKIYNTFF
jgi:YcaO-like protein with predicted kinase domain